MSEAETHGHEAKHPYHLVDPSPWPLFGAIAAGTMFGGTVLYMHDITSWLLPVGVVLVLIAMFLWWCDVVKEATFQGFHTPIVQIGLRYGMALFIASEVMFFVAFFWAYFNAWLDPTEATGFIWPPQGIEVFEPFDVPFLNTLILLLSGCTVTFAHHAVLEGDQRGSVKYLIYTVALGMLFTSLQAYEYVHAAFGFTDGIYPSTFFMATGFHGFHVIIGTSFLAVCLYRAWRGHFKPDHHFGLEAAAWYWHFVDVVWLFLWSFIYFWSS